MIHKKEAAHARSRQHERGVGPDASAACEADAGSSETRELLFSEVAGEPLKKRACHGEATP